MKIKNISCTQFAGVRDRNVSFTDGINVIYGKNESGKSTLVNLIAQEEVLLVTAIVLTMQNSEKQETNTTKRCIKQSKSKTLNSQEW